MKKLASIAISLSILLSTSTPLLAAVTTSQNILAPGETTTDVQATIAQTKFNVTVPTGLPVNISELGEITVSDKAKIQNNSIAPVQVNSIKVTPAAGWYLSRHAVDFPSAYKINDTHISMEINGSDTNPDTGFMELTATNWPIIPGQSEQPLAYHSKVSLQSSSKILTAANVIITIGFAEAGTARFTDLEPHKADITPNDTRLYQFDFENILADSVTINWETSDHTVATVTPIGKRDGRGIVQSGTKQCQITGVGIGTATITGTLPDGTMKSQEITVKTLVPKELKILTEPTKTEYTPGTAFDTAGLKLALVYNNNTTKELTDTDLTITDGGKLVIGQQHVTIEHQGLTIKQPIKVLKPVTDSKYFQMGDRQIIKFNKDLPGCPTDIVIPEMIDGQQVLSIRNDAFWNAGSITSIEFPEVMTSIGQYAFYGCSSLKSVTLPKKIKNLMPHVFSTCTSLETVNIHNNIQYISGSAFDNCTSLKSINIAIPKNEGIIDGYWDCPMAKSQIVWGVTIA